MASNTSPFKTNLAHEPIPESPRQEAPTRFSPKKEFTDPVPQPSTNPDKTSDQEDSEARLLPGDPTKSSATRLGGSHLDGGVSDAGGEPAKTNPTTTKGLKAQKPTLKAAAATTAKSVTKAPKSPLTTKAPAPREPAKGSAQPAASSGNTKKLATTKSAGSKPSALDLSQASTGFVKPKPKSPTRPVKLPASLTAPTAASAQKLGNGNAAPSVRQPLSHNSTTNAATHRAASRNSILTTGSAVGAKTLKHKSSTVGRSRPSLGPPPKSNATESSGVKKEAPVDESFLAHMMRPTASSSSKTSEKAPVTPPRKHTAPTKKLDQKDGGNNAKKVLAKIQASSSKTKATKDSIKTPPSPAKQSSRPRDVVAKAAPVEAEAADPIVETNKPATETLPEAEADEGVVKSEPPVEEIAPVVAQQETAEEIIDIVKSTEESGSADVPATEEAKVAALDEPAAEEPAVEEPAARKPLVEEPTAEEYAIRSTEAVPQEPNVAEAAQQIEAAPAASSVVPEEATNEAHEFTAAEPTLNLSELSEALADIEDDAHKTEADHEDEVAASL